MVEVPRPFSDPRPRPMGLPAELSSPKNRRSYTSPVDALRRSEHSMAHPEPAGHEEEEHHGSPWPVIIAVGMGVGYVGIVTASIGASWTLRLRTTTLGDAFQGPWAQPGEILNVPLTGLNTFILICSSLTMVEGLAAAERGDQRKLRIFLLATLLLGMTFLSIQAFEYQKLYFGEGLTFKSAPFGVNPLYGPTFYAQTGVHGSHVTAGVLAMAYITRKAFKGGFTKENHEAVELVGLYWHFVDVVWIFLFTIVYLI